MKSKYYSQVARHAIKSKSPIKSSSEVFFKKSKTSMGDEIPNKFIFLFFEFLWSITNVYKS